MSIKLKIKPIKFYWSHCKADDDKFFYFGPTLQASFTNSRNSRVNVYGKHLIIGKFNVVFGCIDEP